VGDGCTVNCLIDNLYQCVNVDQQASACTFTCGDGSLTPATTEVCDDGNLIASPVDGCNALCQVDNGWECLGTSGTATHCTTLCGNGKREGSNSEVCDDGDNISGDGCSSTC
jgi:cysteine-rich repeat protein